jgi:hypothetical protein
VCVDIELPAFKTIAMSSYSGSYSRCMTTSEKIVIQRNFDSYLPLGTPNNI